MRAAVFHQVGEPLVIETIDAPKPQSGEVIIKVKACGICGTDLHAIVDPSMLLPAGIVLGHEFAGEVVELGSGVPVGWSAGDRVCTLPYIGCGTCLACLTGVPWQCPSKQLIGMKVDGGFAEYARVHVNEAVKLPDSVSYHEGALVEPLAVGLHAVRFCRGVAGKDILVIGAGPIGLAVAHWCTFFGARQVIVSEFDPGRAQRALDMGATGFVDAKGDVCSQFRGLTGGAPEVIFECVGVPGLIASCINMASFGAEIVVVGFCTKPDSFVPALATRKEITLKFSVGNNKSDFQFIVDMMAANRVQAKAMITGVVSLQELPGMLEELRNPDKHCKVLLNPEL